MENQNKEEVSKCCGEEKMDTRMYPNEKPWCLKCGKPFEPKNPITQDWKEELYVECIEDLIFYAKMFHLAKDKAKAQEDIRNQIRKIESFIEKVRNDALEKQKEKIKQEFKNGKWRKMIDRNGGEDFDLITRLFLKELNK